MFATMLEQLAGTAAAPDDICWLPAMPGLRVCAFDCAMRDGPLKPCLAQGHYETLFCLEGEVRIDMQDGRIIQIEGRDILLLSDLSRVREVAFSGRRFRGVLVLVDGAAARESLDQLRALLGGLRLDIGQVGALMRSYGGCTAIRKSVWSESVFTVMEDMPADEGGQYCILKAAELLLLLCGGRFPMPREPGEARYDTYQMEKVRKIHDYMRAHLEEPMTIEGLSQQFNISPTLLKSSFRQAHGQPLHSYLQECRLRRAAELLTTTVLPVTQVAEQAGYQSASQFGAVFKRRYQLSPLQYRLAARVKSKTDGFSSEPDKNGGASVIN